MSRSDVAAPFASKPLGSGDYPVAELRWQVVEICDDPVIERSLTFVGSHRVELCRSEKFAFVSHMMRLAST